ncbi:acetyl-CoA carboxylase carboxyl transferase subunit beta [Minwuia thermotolerans]|uniref:Acetyl-coenzyme A carboxylase carboxyl transferase subunit beta n=2 Tax=Minwuia thermotolerans TaxID=2056226 RepID=A0A2M9G5G2_9PROT|nr:acetyl-CoA carboxylase, carboxyltransferase subunit beta [Minwuia thermotolerans]PJK30940.1 acetyl-CoA carboxylase carboxyl transferase subunit beta [Minwuia thermotolerans]
MSWLTNTVLPKIGLGRKKDSPDNLWEKCRSCGQMVFHRDLEQSHRVCPHCDHHMRLKAGARLRLLFDDGKFTRVRTPEPPLDPLKFRDARRYTDQLKEARSASGSDFAVEVGFGRIGGLAAVIAAQNFFFMGGSVSAGEGEAIIAAAEKAVEKDAALVVCAASGGMRMQEGILSLMQMPRTTVALQRLRDAGLPYICVLTDPTTGGTTASFAMIGDVTIAEPGALIGFAGPRVIEQTIREQLPDGFQRAEYLLDHGMVDMVIHRHQLAETVARVISLLRVKTVEPPKPLPKPDAEVAIPMPNEAVEETPSAGAGTKAEGKSEKKTGGKSEKK